MRRVEIIGNLGADAEHRFTQDGTNVLNFRVGASGSRKNEETVWVKCALFGKRGEALTQYLTKGSRVFVRGEFKLRSWTSETSGKSGTDVDVTVDEIELLGGVDKREAPGGGRDW